MPKLLVKRLLLAAEGEFCNRTRAGADPIEAENA